MKIKIYTVYYYHIKNNNIRKKYFPNFPNAYLTSSIRRAIAHGRIG